MAELNKVLADGVPSRVRIILAPELCPATVIFEGLPPNEAMLFFTNFNALTTSLGPRLVLPFGAK